ncbi:MAG: hypothetical protein WA777_08760 [Rhodanobacter sp.]
MTNTSRTVFTLVSLMLASAVNAQNDPTVPRICYAVVDADFACTQNDLDFAVTHNNPDAAAAAARGMTQLATSRLQFPAAIRNSGVDAVIQSCSGPMKEGALATGAKIIQRIQASGGDASRCQAAVNAIH